MSFKIQLTKPHAGQSRLLRESRRYNVAVCGRRWGKTYLAHDILVDGPRHKGAIHGFPVAFYAPTYQTMLESWRTMKKVLAPVTSKISEQDKRIDLITGGVVEFWSLDNPDAGRGRKYATAIVDEAAMIKRLDEAVDQNIMPLLLDYQGELWLISTPKGRNHFETYYQRGCADNPDRDEDWQSWQLPTWDNPYINRDDIEKLRGTMSRLAYLQEITAEFVSFAGTFVLAEHIHTGAPPAGLTLYMGVDLALSLKESADYTAIVVLGVDAASGRIWIVDAERKRVGFREQLAFIAAKAERWRPVDILIEATQYQAVVVEELLRSTDLPVRQVRPDKDKLTRAQGLITRYENHLVWHATGLGRDYNDEILSFGPDCDHDDLVDAAVYAYMASGDYGRSHFLFPDDLPIGPIAHHADLPSLKAQLVEPDLPEGTCGRCTHQVKGRCQLLGCSVGVRDTGCQGFLERIPDPVPRGIGWELPA